MTAASTTATESRGRALEIVLDWARRNIWTLGLLGLLALMLAFTRAIQPTYGAAGIQGLANSVLPLALAAVAQTIVVISPLFRSSVSGAPRVIRVGS